MGWDGMGRVKGGKAEGRWDGVGWGDMGGGG